MVENTRIALMTLSAKSTVRSDFFEASPRGNDQPDLRLRRLREVPDLLKVLSEELRLPCESWSAVATLRSRSSTGKSRAVSPRRARSQCRLRRRRRTSESALSHGPSSQSLSRSRSRRKARSAAIRSSSRSTASSASPRLFAGYYVLQLGTTHCINARVWREKTEEFKALEPKRRRPRSARRNSRPRSNRATMIVKRIEDRFYWAPMLEELAELVPREVQITPLRRRCPGRRLQAVHASPSTGFPPEPIRAGWPRICAPRSRRNSRSNYKNVTSTFKTLEDGTRWCRLDGTQMPTATFAINVQLSTAAKSQHPHTRHAKRNETRKRRNPKTRPRGAAARRGVVYSYFTMLLGPAHQRPGRRPRQSIVALEPQIATAKAQIKTAANVEARRAAGQSHGSARSRDDSRRLARRLVSAEGWRVLQEAGHRQSRDPHE